MTRSTSFEQCRRDAAPCASQSYLTLSTNRMQQGFFDEGLARAARPICKEDTALTEMDAVQDLIVQNSLTQA
jgi:hypothetical protein